MKKELRKLRKRCLELSYMGGDGNLQSCFSSMEILWALYNGGMHWSKDIATSDRRDMFVLSKGQSSLGLIVMLEDKGLLEKEDVEQFCKYGSMCSMQLDVTKFKQIGGVENSAGSLGHGFPMAVGMAYADRIKKSSRQIYILAGDGEMNEGSMWEAAAFAGGHQLESINLIVDDNGSIGRMLDMGSIGEKLQTFGFHVSYVNGHNVDEVLKAIDNNRSILDRPKAIIAHTFRGYGSRTLLDKNEWFHKAPNEVELKRLLREVDEF